MLGCGIALAKVNQLRNLLERGGQVSLTDCSHLANVYVPLVKSEELSLLLAEICGQHVGLIFDGSARPAKL
jgi:hypothetical protein